jgi:hypothetical protein
MAKIKPLSIILGIFTIFLFLMWSLTLLNVIGAEYKILTRWVSTIGLILCGVLIGILISEKKIRIQGMLVPFLLFVVGFFAAPFVGIGTLMVANVFSVGRGIEPLVFGGSITGYLLLYMGLWFWLKKKGILRFTSPND